jgi:two-component system, NarL family, response regulator DesR
VGFRKPRFESEGLSVIGEAADGAAAVVIALDATADVVLMDLQMPVMGGIEATRRIKEASAPTQVIVLTSHEGPLLERSAAEAGGLRLPGEGLRAGSGR